MHSSIAPSFPSTNGDPVVSCIAAPDQAQLQRFELKYLISESTARAMRQFVRCYLRPDEFAAHSADFSYAVHTLYLDTPDLCLYGATTGGDRNRFKLRVRFYDDGGEAPAFFEIKRRCDESISKLRAKVRREAVQPLLLGEYPQLRHLVKADPRQFFALQEFSRRMHHLGASPRSHVGYAREAWMSPADNSMRVTFDRQVQCEPQFSAKLHARVAEENAVTPFESHVIFELKFTNRMPNWCGELVRAFGLVRGGAAKYAEGVALMGEDRLSNCGVGITVPPMRSAVPAMALHGQTIHA